MKALRISASIFALTALSLLAACGGGGGGGGGTPPTSAPTGGPTSHPTATPSTGPTSSPTTSPTATPTTSGTVPVSTYTIQAQTGPLVNPPGGYSWYTSGVTVSWTPSPGHVGQNGDTSAGANSTNGFPAMDGMSCAATVEPAASQTTYSVHAFVGIYYNGTELALPQAIGMNNPTEPIASGHPNDNYEVETQTCEYNIHTHDYSGLVHIEDINASQSQSTTSPLSYSPTLKSLLDIWGVTLSATGLTVPGQTTLSGPVAVYVGNQGSNLGPNGAHVTDSYTKAAKTDGSDVGLAWHTTVWIVIGNGFPSQPTSDVGLPKVEWRVQY